ncbi:MAG: hypothetical protein JXA99_16965 [Candidatus Lokiarchaeota archaeon]|nr:hypothetical protein [Candidatus Lokiarchaeota archaeon]
MTLNGFIVLNNGGIPLYSKFIDIDLTIDSLLLGGFFSAIQTFVKELDDTKESFINEMQVHQIIFLYREIESLLFVGIKNSKEDFKSTLIVFEYMIWIFISKYQNTLKKNDTEVSLFNSFDDLFIKYRTSKEKDLKKLLLKESIGKNLLQGILNNLTNYFPIKELIKLEPDYLKIIGKELILVSFNITSEKEESIIENLKMKVTNLYGPGMFESLLKSLKNK